MAVLVLGLSVPFLVAPQASAAPEGRTIHVSASSGSDAGDGSAARPYQTISTAISAASTGDTIELADGTYREGELSVDKGVTIRAAQGATPVISGAKVPETWNNAGNGTWSTGHDMVRFCTVCTTNADPEVEGMAAHPEQVFVDGKPLTQVGSRAEVSASTFYVDDPDPVTLKEAGNNRAGYNVKPHTGASYVIGVDPAQHEVEVVQHHRALSSTADNVTLSGVVVEKYSAVQRWDYADPEIGTLTGGGMVVASGNNLRIEGSTFRYSSSATAVQVIDATSAVVTGNRFDDNGSNGFGINNSTNVTVERNLWTSNNTAGHITTGCGAYCTLADTKITHADGVRFAFNTVDYSEAGYDISEPAVYADQRGAGVWFDEGVINSEIIGNYFVNTPVAMFNEVSSNNLIASNIVEGAGVGIHVSGSDNTKIWNNTISHALTSVMIQEDSRSDGCNARRADGSCAQLQPWSAEHGLSWDTTGTVINNNIFSSEQTQAKEGDPWRFSAMLQVTGGVNDDGSGAVYANDMISSIDHNVYYRAQDNGNPSTTVLWNWGKDLATQSINPPELSEFTASSHVTVSGKEANGLDRRGTRAENPFFVSESANPTAWKTSDFHLKPGSPASGTGQALPADVAGELGVSAGTAVDRGALVNVAWDGGSAQAGAGAPAPAQGQPAAQSPAAGADQASAGQASAAQDGAAQDSAPQAPAGQAPAAQAPTDQAPAGQASADQAPAAQDGAAQDSAPQAPAGQAPAAQDGAAQDSAAQAPAAQAPAAQAPAGGDGAGSGGASGSAPGGSSQAGAGQAGTERGASGDSAAGSASTSAGAARSGSGANGHAAAAGVTIASDSVPGGVDDHSPVGAVAVEAQPAKGASSAQGGSLARAGLVAPGLIILSVAAVVLGAGALASRRRMSRGR
ncbi:right-handed parallel beta-helix repeat-containing protein [Actinomyces bowdenii]|uniref:right-handed parallel beta-helix repeat-containing protein n=1 Tax=Actinomyces bowdenii TaxID=131109 RepID=UPI00214BA770|nr:right-handed parallel beta-helix repeat-containing protein [Actinomyces bowdenii]